MRPILGYSVTFIAILISGTWSLPEPTCYEPTSGQGPALLTMACLKTGADIFKHYPLLYYFLIHEAPPTPRYIQVPLGIERNGCLFTMDFLGPTRILEVTPTVIVEAIGDIASHCLGKENNTDGGQIVGNLGDDIYIRYTLQHPEPRLTGMNTSSLGDSQPNENFIIPAHLNASLARGGDDEASFVASDR